MFIETSNLQNLYRFRSLNDYFRPIQLAQRLLRSMVDPANKGQLHGVQTLHARGHHQETGWSLSYQRGKCDCKYRVIDGVQLDMDKCILKAI